MSKERFNQNDNKLFVDMDWKEDLRVGEHLVIDCFRKLSGLLISYQYKYYTVIR